MNKLLFAASTFLALTSEAPLYARPTKLFPVTWNGSEFICADLKKMGSTLPDAVRYWIAGMWTGLNIAGAQSEVGHSTTVVGAVTEVQLYCDNHQSASLVEATLATYERMATEKK
jgi:hypothetical protein